MRRALLLVFVLAVAGRADAESAKGSRWSVGLPIGLFLFDGDNGGVEVAVGVTRVSERLRVESGVGVIENPIDSGPSFRAHVGIQRGNDERVAPFVTAGYRYVSISDSCRNSGCDSYSAHVLSLRAGVELGGRGFHWTLGVEVGPAIQSRDTVDDTSEIHRFDSFFYGGFVELAVGQ